MTDYKNTLNLPTTEFPMKANLAQREPEILAYWESIDLYRQLRTQRQGKQKFILHDGPPYANGHLHIGHSVNKILKDIVVKSKTLSGLDAPFVPGWDCHGLPIELNVEKKFGKAGEKLSAKEFRAACRQYAKEQIDIQRAEFIRHGVLGDWSHPYRTMDFSFEANIMRTLAHLIANGHFQQGFKPVHWCIDCKSALAEAEVEYIDKPALAVDARFHIVEEEKFLQPFQFKSTQQGTGPISIPIWTTTPWTIPGNAAVALSPASRYLLIQIQSARGTERIVLIPALLESTLSRYGIKDYEILAEANSNHLENFLLQHPFYERQVPIILSDHVTDETGTGAVSIAPAHGPEDFIVGARYKLPCITLIDTAGHYTPETPSLAGVFMRKGDAHVLELLKQKNNLLCEEKVTHSYPHCWRHKTPLIFLATPQWFISMDKNHLREQALTAIKQVQWTPDWGQSRIYGMIEQRPDWCISRQRVWGVPLPLFIHKQSRTLHPETLTLIEEVTKQVEKNGVEVWHELDQTILLGKEAEHYEKSRDTLDVWFDSGSSHFAILKHDPVLAWPADLYLEGSDQHRGWFQSSLLTSTGLYQTAPYKAVLTHGFTVDEKGRKMSKSLGNVIAPDKVMNSLGADILRLWVSSTDYRSEIAVSDEILKRTAEAYRRIRNTMRFLLANLHDFDPDKHLVSSNNLLALDQWIIERAHSLQTEIIRAYDDYQFHLIYQKLHNFCVVELGSFYLDIIKDRQYTLQKNSIARRSAQTALYHIAEAMVRWCAPILSFTAEEVWRYLPGKHGASVLLEIWYDIPLEKTLLFTPSEWEMLIQIRNAVNKELEKQRAADIIGSALEAEVELYCSIQLQSLLNKLKNELRFVLITSKADVFSEQQRPQTAVVTDISGLFIKINASSHNKCARCWHRREDVGNHKEHPDICSRCVDNLPEGTGEIRQYA